MPRKSQNNKGKTKNSQRKSRKNEKKDIILHLTIDPSEFESFDNEKNLSQFSYNPDVFEEPEPYTDPLEDIYESINNNNGIKNNVNMIDIEKEVMEKIKNNENYNVKLMNDYKNLNAEKRRPKETYISCWWDCHPFQGTPIGIPKDYKNDVYHIYGNFCSPECAAGYLFNEQLSNNEKYRRYEMLHEYYHKINGNKINNLERIELAPNKIILKKFGGYFEIEKYRELIKNYSKKMNIIQPPLMSIIPSLEIETRDTMFSNHNQLYVPIDENQLMKAKNVVLKRNKPLKVGGSLKDIMMLKMS
jgi:hypothetical protein